MRGLTFFISRIRLHFRRQHEADLEQLLSDLLTARQALDDEITHAVERLIEAREQTRAASTDAVDQLPNNIAPRSYL